MSTIRIACFLCVISVCSCSRKDGRSSDIELLTSQEISSTSFVSSSREAGWTLYGSDIEDWSVFYHSKKIQCNEGDTITASFNLDGRRYEKDLTDESFAILGRLIGSEELSVAIFRRERDPQPNSKSSAPNKAQHPTA
ncbi:hypothetical protein [Sulfuriroseicoccus oceanibius]|uniref:Uncharacterized protein n=1 Tax=Sulfuriroseicoccus oceanibius TaxID=2707525 RepID=A0A6B3L165_9BACT|nr:hypothetical protein [Sulfuriroseicoccus oceanibius]QQL44084.1 hypothetical protein G3M56_009275 [Sulfuriroseicoccus oceanibius]